MRWLTVVLAAIVLFVATASITAMLWLSPTQARHGIAGVEFSSVANAQVDQPTDGTAPARAGVTVTGEGVIAVKPDLARVTLGVEVSNPSASAAQQDAAVRMDAVVGQLRNLGIEERDIQTTRFDLSPEYENSTNGGRSPVLRGYRVTNMVSVTVRDVSKVGSVLDAVVASGATRLQGISFGVSDPAAAGVQGREEAMKNARSKADQLARLAGGTLGPAVAIEETVSASPQPMVMRDQAAVAAPATPISPGTQEVRVIVRVTYSLK